MARLIIKASESRNPSNDAIAQKGDILHIAEDGYVFGEAEAPPSFIIIDVPGVSQAAIVKHSQPWYRIIKGEVIGTTATHARVRLYTEHPGATNRFGITRELVEEYITKVGGVIQSTETNGIVFDILKEETRAETRAKFFDLFKSEFGDIMVNRRWHFSDSQVDTVLDSGGYLTVTPSQLANNLQDKAI